MGSRQKGLIRMSQSQEIEVLLQDSTIELTECTHHWVIETPSGPVSRGRCKLCDEDREFQNFLENAPYWEDDVSLDQVSSGANFRRETTNSVSEDESEG